MGCVELRSGYNSGMSKSLETIARPDDHELVTKGYLRNEFSAFRVEFKKELKEELVTEITEMVDLKLQGMMDILMREMRIIREDIKIYRAEFKEYQINQDRHISSLESRVDVLEIIN